MGQGGTAQGGAGRGGMSGSTGGAIAGGGASNDAGATDSGAPTGCPTHVLPATCAAPYLNDRDNCCVAGRSCQGGACLNGKCQPVFLETDTATDAQNIVATGNLLVSASGCDGMQIRRT